MQKDLSKREIRERLNFLRAKLTKQPTAVNTLYVFPPRLGQEVAETNYSQDSLQRISDHIGYYLGLLRSVIVTLIETPTAKWIGTEGGTLVGGEVDSPISGLYEVIGNDHGQVLLIKKQKYEVEHILAILAHECTHNYLYHHGVRAAEEVENEILTDLATAYLGLGHLLIPGYKPVTWTSDHWNIFFASGCAMHTLSIGYVTPKTLKRATILSAELRNWNGEEVELIFSSWCDRRVAHFQLGSCRRKFREVENRKIEVERLAKSRTEQIASLRKEVGEINQTYDQVCDLIKRVARTRDPSSIRPKDGRLLVEITNKISTGEPLSEIRSISERIDSLEEACADDEHMSKLTEQIHSLRATINNWYNLLDRHSRY